MIAPFSKRIVDTMHTRARKNVHKIENHTIRYDIDASAIYNVSPHNSLSVCVCVRESGREKMCS